MYKHECFSKTLKIGSGRGEIVPPQLRNRHMMPYEGHTLGAIDDTHHKSKVLGGICLQFMTIALYFSALQISTPRASIIMFSRPHSRGNTNAKCTWRRVSSCLWLVGDVHTSLSQTQSRHHPAITATLHTLPRKFANIGSTGRVGARQAAR